MELQLLKRRGNPDLARLKIKSRNSLATLSPNLETVDNFQQQFTYRSQTLFTGSSDSPIQSQQEKKSSRFPLQIINKLDYEESLRGIFAANGSTRLKFQKGKAEEIVIKAKKYPRFSRISKRCNKCKETLYEIFPWLTVIPFLGLGKEPIEQDDDPNDVDCDALE